MEASASRRLPRLELVAEVEVRSGDLPGLQDGEASTGPAPLDVLGEPVVVLDALPDGAQLPHRIVGQRLHGSAILGHRDRGRTLARHIGHGHDELLVDLTVDDLERRLRHDQLVGVDVAGHDRLAQAPARVEEELEGVRRHRVGREQHACHVGREHLLDHDGQRHSLVGEPLGVAVGDRPGRSRATPSSAARHRGRQPLRRCGGRCPAGRRTTCRAGLPRWRTIAPTPPHRRAVRASSAV